MTDWDRLDAGKYQDETRAIAALLKAQPLAGRREAVLIKAQALVSSAREAGRRDGLVESFLQQFSLSTPEGLALMGLAEALLRTPDAATKDRLIAEKISAADWAAHLGQSDSLLVNASTWGLMLTGRLIDVSGVNDAMGTLRKLAVRVGEPVVRAAVAQAIRIMGEQFVLGRTIEDAIARAAKEMLLCSFDMLGEGARTRADAEKYEAAYAQAITAIGKVAAGPEAAHGISVKLSALSPRYEPTQDARVWSELYPRVLRLAQMAARADINFTLDAEEADRLVISLKLLDRLAHEPSLGDWRGLGLAVQAYQKRAPDVITRLAALAKDSGRRLMVRLVKGAYWDSEIKRAQVAGRPGYPVFTTKPATDLSYLVCARMLIDAAPHLYAQFATHNAHTLAAVRAMADGMKIEHQRLHGMGEALWCCALVDAAVLRERLVNVGQRRAAQRLAHVLCELLLRLRIVGLAENSYDLPLSQTDLADTIGVSNVHLNRVLQELRREDLISWKHEILAIKDIDQLMKYSGFNPNYLHIGRQGADPAAKPR